MKIQDLITEENVFLDLDAADSEEALAVVADRVAGLAGVVTADVVRALSERERLGSTSVGDGFAIPHCKLGNVRKIWIALARFLRCVEFSASDRAQVCFFFVVLSPPDQPAAHLQVLSQIARILKHKELKARLLATREASTIVAEIMMVAEMEGL